MVKCFKINVVKIVFPSKVQLAVKNPREINTCEVGNGK